MNAWAWDTATVDFTTFDVEYDGVLNRGLSMPRAEFAVEVERLRALADEIEPASDQDNTHRLVAKLDTILAQHQPAASESMTTAIQIHRRARNAKGTLQQRIDQLRAGMDEIGRIADGADREEQGQIRHLTESLGMLAESLQITTSEPRD